MIRYHAAQLPRCLVAWVRFGAGNVEAATALAIGVGLRNMREGLAVASALLTLPLLDLPSVHT